MKKRQILRALSLLAAVCIAAGCKQSVSGETSTMTAVQTNLAAGIGIEKTTISENSEEIINPIPEGWSIEKIASLIEIDGAPLKFPCTPEGFESMSDKISLGQPDEYLNYCDIYYNNTNVGTLTLNLDSGYCDSLMIYTDLINDIGEINIKGYEIDKINIIIPYLDDCFTENVNPELSSELHKVLQFNEGNNIFVFSFRHNNQEIEMIHFALSYKEDCNE